MFVCCHCGSAIHPDDHWAIGMPEEYGIDYDYPEEYYHPVAVADHEPTPDPPCLPWCGTMECWWAGSYEDVL